MPYSSLDQIGNPWMYGQQGNFPGMPGQPGQSMPPGMPGLMNSPMPGRTPPNPAANWMQQSMPQNPFQMMQGRPGSMNQLAGMMAQNQGMDPRRYFGDMKGIKGMMDPRYAQFMGKPNWGRPTPGMPGQPGMGMGQGGMGGGMGMGGSIDPAILAQLQKMMQGMGQPGAAPAQRPMI